MKPRDVLDALAGVFAGTILFVVLLIAAAIAWAHT